MIDSRIISEILIEGLSDWLSFAEVNRYVRVSMKYEADEAAFDMTLQIIAEMLDKHFIEVGEIGVQPPRFLPWLEPCNSVVKRLRQRITETLPVTGIRPGDVCWIALTQIGSETATNFLATHRAIKDHEQQEQ